MVKIDDLSTLTIKRKMSLFYKWTFFIYFHEAIFSLSQMFLSLVFVSLPIVKNFLYPSPYDHFSGTLNLPPSRGNWIIFLFIWDFMEGCPEINFSTFLKNSSRDKWVSFQLKHSSLTQSTFSSSALIMFLLF